MGRPPGGKEICSFIYDAKKNSARRDSFLMGVIMDRDIKTLDTINKEQLETLKAKSVCIVGVGGLGGYAVEMFTRLGIGTIRIVDGDVFEVSNLNRQLFSTENNMGKSKVKETCLMMGSINSNVKCEIIDDTITSDNVMDAFKGVDITVDCVDNIKTRYIMQDACKELNIPMIHGAVGAWQGQVSTIFPGDETINKIYGDEYKKEILPIGTASFLPAVIASYQVSECVKVLLGKGEILQNKVLYIDILNNQNYIVDLNENPEDT